MKCYDPSREEMDRMPDEGLDDLFRKSEMAVFNRKRGPQRTYLASFCDPQLTADRALVVMAQRMMTRNVPVNTGMTRSELFTAWRRYLGR